MPFKPGNNANPGGRPRSKVPRVADVLYSKSISPVDEALKELVKLETPMERFKGWMLLLEYCEGKAKNLTDDIQEMAAELSAILKLPEEKVLELGKLLSLPREKLIEQAKTIPDLKAG